MLGELDTLAPTEVLDLARKLTWRADSRHWTFVGKVLLKIETEGLYTLVKDAAGQPYENSRDYAEDQLYLARSEFYGFLRLARMVRDAPQVPSEKWAQVNRQRATLLAQLATLGDIAPWVQKALTLKTYAEFKREVMRYLDPEATDFISIRIPRSLEPLLDEACRLALPQIDEGAAEGRVKDADMRFRCLELVLLEYVQPHRASPAE
jgi:hypothetical protein